MEIVIGIVVIGLVLRWLRNMNTNSNCMLILENERSQRERGCQ